MGRRRHVALASAIAILLMGSLLSAVLFGLTGSVRGREFIRAQVERALASVTKGKIHIGTLSGSFLTELAIDSLEFREPNDSLFFATGPVRFTYDPRDIVDGVIFLRSLDVQRPVVRLQRRHDAWNYQSIFPSGGSAAGGPRRGFGSRISLTNVRVRGGEVRVALPWGPADSLTGVRRDSAITRALAYAQGGVRRIGPNEYEKEWKWSGLAVQLSHAHVADPDTSGHHFEIVRLDVLERDPPFNVRNLRGTIWRRGDTLSIDVPRPGEGARGLGERPPHALRHPRSRGHDVDGRHCLGVRDAADHRRRHDGPAHQERARPARHGLRHPEHGRAHHQFAAARQHDVWGRRPRADPEGPRARGAAGGLPAD
ncbi:MAG: hypothetical protein NTW72_03425 [Gemmatimonadetes bacterium]|nr:hypothetical protein [Gemmatimonadota bacterium]